MIGMIAFTLCLRIGLVENQLQEENNTLFIEQNEENIPDDILYILEQIDK